MRTPVATERTDEQLLAQARSEPGSPAAKQAASELLGRYQQRVYAWCLRHVRDHDQALDLAQEVLISAYRNLGSFQERARFSSWLFAIARNRCVSALRRPRLLYEEERDPDQLHGSGPGPAEALEEKLGEEALLELIRTTLSPREQEVVWLRCFERMPVETITRMLGIRQASGARGVLQSARRKLRAALPDLELRLRGAQP
ncbi:MAG: sigma-70 family RNA polymerase sigma factor [Candidatus Eisenbacteria bacterium]|nr:sigma-70 family RNA polymerase sigma factor [Candidatus Eisenbacteria bacterium]